MPSPSETESDTDAGSVTREQLEGGRRLELAGLRERAVEQYAAVLDTAPDTADRVQALLGVARVHRSRSEWDQAIRDAREAARIAAAAGCDDLVAEALNVEVGVYQLRGDFALGEDLALVALTYARAPRVRGILLQNRGAIAARREDFAAAAELFAESVVAFREAGYELGIAIALINASAAARDCGDAARAVVLAREAAEIARRLDALDFVLLAIENEAHALVDLRRLDEAEELLGEALGHFTSTDNILRQAECLEILGRLYALRPELRDVAIRCFESAHALAVRVGERVLSERLAKQLADVRRPEIAGVRTEEELVAS
jgi:tetratricopeptide (TPR) repeat protein